MRSKLSIQLIAVSLLFVYSTGYSQIFPTYDMTITGITTQPNATTGADSVIQFDVMILWTNSAVSDPFEYGAGQLTIRFNKNVVNPGASLFSSKVAISGGINFPSIIQNPTVATIANTDGSETWLFQAAANNPNSTTNFFVSDVPPGNRMGRFKIRTSQHHWNCVVPNLKFQLQPPNNTFVAYYQPSADPKDPDLQFLGSILDTVVNHYTTSSSSSLCSSPAPIANFYASATTINAGASVNFYDSSLYNPTSWSWSFPGGSPSSSSVQNPTNIVYSTPGSYSVTLTASNGSGPNTKTKTGYITVINPCSPNWQNKLVLKDAGNVRDTLSFGTSNIATNGLDSCLGELSLPPPPPSGAFDARFILPVSPSDASKKDYRGEPTNDIEWTLTFQPSGSGYPITFSWDSSAFPLNGQFYLTDLLGGSVVNIKMKNQKSYTLTNTGITTLKIQYRYLLTTSVPVKNLWNIVSVPLTAINMSVGSLFPNATSSAYKFDCTLGYVAADSFKNGKGYWLKFGRDTSYTVVGLLVSPRSISVNGCWNLIGPFDENIPVSSIISSPTGIITSSFYGYNNGYFVADTLKSGIGYWVRTSSSGTLVRGSADNLPSAVQSDSMNKWTRIEFTDNGDNISNLYLANSNEITRNYELPPVPPQGIFDVRFSSDKMTEAFGQTHQIKINSAERPLKIKFYNVNGIKLHLKDAGGGSVLDKTIVEDTEIEITQNIDQIIITEENLIPSSYALSQNYPNPFNPKTLIKYQLPKDGNVKLVIYDVLGKEVSVLENSFRKAGSYQVSFDASNLSSGVYFYKMESGSFMEMKKMIVIK